MNTKKYFYIITYKLKPIFPKIIGKKILDFSHHGGIDISLENNTPSERFKKIETKCVAYWNSCHDAANQWNRLKHYVVFYHCEAE